MNIKHLPFSKKTLVVVIAAVLNAGIHSTAHALSNIIMDGTTGTGSGATQNFLVTHPNLNQIIPIEGGGANPNGTVVTGTANTNLFFSFDQFNISSGDTARFQCTGCPTINNVISRVTGNLSSTNIYGTLQSTVPNANFWLINPNGINFGANAQITVPAAFHIGTADSILAANGTPVYSTNPPTSTLTAATPTQFGFGAAAGNIQITNANVVLTAGANSEIASAGNMDIGGSQIQSNGNGAITLSAQSQISVGGFSDAPTSSLSKNIDLIAGTNVFVDFGSTVGGNANANNNLDNSGTIQGNAIANNQLNNIGTIEGNAITNNGLLYNGRYYMGEGYDYGSGIIQGNAIATNGSIINGYDNNYISFIPSEFINNIQVPTSAIKGDASAGISIINNFNSIIGTSTANQITTGSLFNHGTINGNVQLTSTLTNTANATINGDVVSTHINTGNITGNFYANQLNNEGVINGNTISNIVNQGNIIGNAIVDNTAFTGNGTTIGIKTGNIINRGNITGFASAIMDITNNSGSINNGVRAGNDLTNNGGTINGSMIRAERNLINQNNAVINTDAIIVGDSLLNDSGAKIIMRNGSTFVTTGNTLKVTNGASIQASNTGNFNLISGGQFIVDNNALISATNTGNFSIQANGLPLNIQFSALTDKNFYDFIVSDGGKIQKNNSGKMTVTAKNIFLNGVDVLVGSNAGLIDFNAVPENVTNKSLFPGYFKMKEATITNSGAFSITGYYLNLDPSGIKSDEAVVLNVSNPQEISFAKVLIGKGTSLFARGMGKDFIDVPTGKLIINGDIPNAPDDNEAVLTRFIPPVNTNFKLAELEKRPCNTNKNTLGTRNAKGYLPNLSYQVNYSLLSALGNNEIEPVAMDLTRELECSFS